MPTQSTNSLLTAEQRCHAVAAILARGVLRYHRRMRQLDSTRGENSPDFSPGGLEVLGNPRLSVSERTRAKLTENQRGGVSDRTQAAV